MPRAEKMVCRGCGDVEPVGDFWPQEDDSCPRQGCSGTFELKVVHRHRMRRTDTGDSECIECGAWQVGGIEL